MTVGRDAIDQHSQARYFRQCGRCRNIRGSAGGTGDEKLAKRIQADQVERLQANLIDRQGFQDVRNIEQGSLLTLEDSFRQEIAAHGSLGQDAVDHQVLLLQTNASQFFMRPGNLAQRGGLGPGDQDQPGAHGVSQSLDRRLVLGALLLQPGQRAETGSIAFVLVEKARPCARQLQQADGVTGRRGIEDDVIVADNQRRVSQQRGELVEGGNFRGACAGQLLFDPFHDRFRQHAPHRTDDPVPIGLGRCLRVNLQREQARNSLDIDNSIADVHAKHLADIRGRIGADQQNATPAFGQLDGGGTGNRGFTHPTLAGKKQIARRLFKEFHGGP